MNKKYLTIAFEGPDGTGKTTQVKEVSQRFAKMGYNVHYVRFPNLLRNDLMQEGLSDEARIILLFQDYRMTMNKIFWSDVNSDKPTLIFMDRIPHISAHIYNVPYCADKAFYPELFGDDYYYQFGVPDVAVIFNRFPYREPDDTFYEQRTSQRELFDYYDSFGFYGGMEPNQKVIRIFGPEGLVYNNSNVSCVTEKLQEKLYNLVTDFYQFPTAEQLKND